MPFAAHAETSTSVALMSLSLLMRWTQGNAASVLLAMKRLFWSRPVCLWQDTFRVAVAVVEFVMPLARTEATACCSFCCALAQ